MPSALGSTGFALFQALSLEFWPFSSWAGGGSSPGQRNCSSWTGRFGAEQPWDRDGAGLLYPPQFCLPTFLRTISSDLSFESETGKGESRRKPCRAELSWASSALAPLAQFWADQHPPFAEEL